MRVPFIIPDGGGFVKLDAGWIFRYHGPDDEVMTMQYLCAPMEGVTGDLFRQAQRQTFPAADSYYTLFLSPTANRTFSPRELREIEPAHNAGIRVVPQLMGHCAEDFLWMAGQLAVFAACPLPVSVKTRLGKTTAETFPALLELYNDYPICELIVHPRVQADQYHGHPDLDMFAYALAHSRAPVCYNGDLFDAPAVRAFQARFPTVERIMLGRGLAANPGFIGQLRTGVEPAAAQFQAFHDRLYAATSARIPDRRALLFRMKEAWRYLGCSFADAERPLRRIRKAQDMIEYESAVRQLFASCPVRENAGYFV